MAETRHTPGVWLHHAGTVYALNADGTNRFSATMQPGNRYEPPRGASWEDHHAARTSAAELVANAARSVLAINNHDALVEALKALLAAYVDLVDSGDCGMSGSAEIPEVIQARAALRDAGAKP